MLFTKVTDLLRDRLQLTDAEQFIRKEFETAPTLRWSSVVEGEHDQLIHEAEDEIRAIVSQEIVPRDHRGL